MEIYISGDNTNFGESANINDDNFVIATLLASINNRLADIAEIQREMLKEKLSDYLDDEGVDVRMGNVRETAHDNYTRMSFYEKEKNDPESVNFIAFDNNDIDR